MVVNDPRPPFRVRLHANHGVLEANVIKPQQVAITAVDFFIGEEKVAGIAAPPYTAAFDAAKYPNAVYARVVAHASDGSEANDVLFFGTNPNEQVDVSVQQVPLSVVGGNRAPSLAELTLLDNGRWSKQPPSSSRSDCCVRRTASPSSASIRRNSG
jgi:hypothetical protein